MAGSTTGNRRRKHRPLASSLDASWIVGPDDESIVSSTSNTPQLTQLTESDLAGRVSTEQQKSETVISSSPETQRLEVPGGLQPRSEGSRSPAPSQSSAGSIAPSATDSNNVTENSSSQQSRGKARKKRYARQHHADWLEDADTMQQLDTTGEAAEMANHKDDVRPPPPPQPQPIYQAVQQPMPPPSMTGYPRQAPSSNSPSIFRLPQSPEHGYDAPPVVPEVRPNYSPHTAFNGSGV